MTRSQNIMLDLSTKCRACALGLGLFIFAAFVPVQAGTISMAWDPVNDPDLDFYRVYYGTAQGVYDQHVDVGNVTSHVLSGLADCTVWYVAVKAVDTAGEESAEYSNEISGWPRPVVSLASPDAGEQGEQLLVTVTGTNFMDGATVEFANTGIVVNSVTVSSCTELVADITIGGSAAPGSTDLDVVNPDQVFGSGPGAFTVLEADVAPSITSQPESRTVTEGATATFSVTADGTEPMSYQWKKDGVDIAGANESSYTTPSTTLDDDGSSFTCLVSNVAGSVESDPAILTVLEQGTRVADGLTALYNFDEGSGDTVLDVSGYGVPMDITVADPANVTWLEGALRIDAPTIIQSAGPATKIIDAAHATDEITVEAWVAPSNLTQDGPARIVAVSESTVSRNLLLGQADDVYDSRCRLSNKNGGYTLTTPAGSLTTALTHVVFVRTVSGDEKIYLDGVERASTTNSGDLSNWADTHRLGLANEFTLDRAWLGEIHLVAFYDRALTPSEIDQNFSAGPDGNETPPANQPPVASFTADPTSGTAPFSVTFDAGTSSDPDGSIVSYDWDFGDGATGSGAVVVHEYTAPGSYTAVLTVTDNDDATDTAEDTITAGEPSTPPTVVSTYPADGEKKVSTGVNPTVTFSEAMDPASITPDRVLLLDEYDQPVPQAAGSPSLSGSGDVATIAPAAVLDANSTYRIRVVGGASGVWDVAGDTMESTFTQASGFTTANAPPGKVSNLRRKDKSK